jgi:hypothetical protein
MLFQIDAQHHMHGGVGHLAIAPQFDMDSLHKDDWIDGCQRPVLPGFYQLLGFVGDLADRAGEISTPYSSPRVSWMSRVETPLAYNPRIFSSSSLLMIYLVSFHSHRYCGYYTRCLFTQFLL